MALLQRQIDKALDNFWTIAEQALDGARAKYIIPYCNRKQWQFSAGMGSWCFYDSKGRYIDRDDAARVLPKRVYAALTAIVINLEAGCHMRSYTPDNYQSNNH